ncbi:MAG: hypothetical protein R3C03_03650 [Pirellulaceae bacterium]
MIQHFSFVAAVFCLALSPMNSLSAEQTPEQIFRECKETVAERTTRTINALETKASRCAHQVQDLLAAGNQEAARQLVRQCIEDLSETATKGKRTISALCRRCTQALRELEAEELANRLEELCDHSKQLINQRLRMLTERLQNMVR